MRFDKLALCMALIVMSCGSPRSNNSVADPSTKTDLARLEGRVLMLRFPDGIRGGHGQIQGDAAREAGKSVGRLERLLACGAISPQVDNSWDHVSYLISRSTARDHEVVECFKRTTSGHFDAGIGLPDRSDYYEMDTSSFSDLADLLPIDHGIYVEAGTDCAGASSAATLSYWGGKNGINSQQVACEIESMTERGSTYVLRRKCENLRFDGSFDDEAEITVLSRTSFVMHVDARAEVPDRTYRYCGSKVVF